MRYKKSMFLKPRGQLFPLTSHPGHELETSGVRTHHHDKELHHIWMVKLAPEVKLSSTVVSLQVMEKRTSTCTCTCTYRVILTANRVIARIVKAGCHSSGDRALKVYISQRPQFNPRRLPVFHSCLLSLFIMHMTEKSDLTNNPSETFFYKQFQLNLSQALYMCKCIFCQLTNLTANSWFRSGYLKVFPLPPFPRRLLEDTLFTSGILASDPGIS